MNREVHVRFWEGLAVRFRWATQLYFFFVDGAGGQMYREDTSLCDDLLGGGGRRDGRCCFFDLSTHDPVRLLGKTGLQLFPSKQDIQNFKCGLGQLLWVLLRRTKQFKAMMSLGIIRLEMNRLR